MGHGMGCGDGNGNGRMDLVLANGWLEVPEDPRARHWTWNSEFELGAASVGMVVADVNGDGLADFVVGPAHDYGLDCWGAATGCGTRSTSST